MSSYQQIDDSSDDNNGGSQSRSRILYSYFVIPKIEINSMDQIMHSLTFLTVRTFLLGFMSTATFTVWLSWNFSAPFQIEDPTLVGWAVALADVGRLMGATGLIFFPGFLHKQYYLQCLIGAIGCLIGLLVGVCQGTPQIVFVFVSLFLIGIGSNPQLVNAMTNVEHKEETRLNSIAFSVGKFVSFGTSLYTLVPAYGAHNSWAMLSLATLLTFFLNLVAKLVLDRLYPHKLIDDSLDNEKAPIMQSALDQAKTQAQSLPLFVWVILVSVSARGNPRSLMISMGPLVFKDHWHLSHHATSHYYFIPLVLSGLIFPVISLTVSHKWQLLLANFMMTVFVGAYPFCPEVLMVSADLCFYGVCAATLESVRVPLLKSVFKEDYKSVTRMVGAQHFGYTLFYAISASYSGYLYSIHYWIPFVVAAIVHFFTGFVVGYIGVILWERQTGQGMPPPDNEGVLEGEYQNGDVKHMTIQPGDTSGAFYVSDGHPRMGGGGMNRQVYMHENIPT